MRSDIEEDEMAAKAPERFGPYVVTRAEKGYGWFVQREDFPLDFAYTRRGARRIAQRRLANLRAAKGE